MLFKRLQIEFCYKKMAPFICICVCPIAVLSAVSAFQVKGVGVTLTHGN